MPPRPVAPREYRGRRARCGTTSFRPECDCGSLCRVSGSRMFLAGDAARGPGNSGQPFGRNRSAAGDTDAEVTLVKAIESGIDLAQRPRVELLYLQRDEVVMQDGSLVVFRYAV